MLFPRALNNTFNIELDKYDVNTQKHLHNVYQIEAYPEKIDYYRYSNAISSLDNDDKNTFDEHYRFTKTDRTYTLNKKVTDLSTDEKIQISALMRAIKYNTYVLRDTPNQTSVSYIKQNFDLAQYDSYLDEYVRHGMSYCYKKGIYSIDDAEDIVQEAALNMYRNYENINNTNSYFYRCVHTSVCNFVKKNKKEIKKKEKLIGKTYGYRYTSEESEAQRNFDLIENSPYELYLYPPVLEKLKSYISKQTSVTKTEIKTLEVLVKYLQNYINTIALVGGTRMFSDSEILEDLSNLYGTSKSHMSKLITRLFDRIRQFNYAEDSRSTIKLLTEFYHRYEYFVKFNFIPAR